MGALLCARRACEEYLEARGVEAAQRDNAYETKWSPDVAANEQMRVNSGRWLRRRFP